MIDPIEDFAGQSTNGSGGPTRERNFWVYAKSDEDVKTILYGYFGIRRGVPFQDVHDNIPDPYCVCVDVRAVPVSPIPKDDFGLWKASVDYAYATSAVRNSRPQAPDLTPKFKIEPNEESVPADIDIYGNPITNAADEPIDPPLTRFKDRETLVITWHKWETDYLTLYAAKRPYRKKLNLNTYFGAPPKCFLCRDIRIDELNMSDQTGIYWLFRLTARLEFREPVTLGGTTYPGWVDVFPNMGKRVKTTDPAMPYKQIREATAGVGNVPIHVLPFLLDPTGFNALGHNPTPNYRSAEQYDVIDMAGLVS